MMADPSFILNLSAEELNAIAACATTAIALFALFVAFWQIKVTKREARLTLAKSLYKEYLTLAMQNPKFSAASYPVTQPRLHEYSNDPDEYERYEFFVSYLMFSAEEILDLVGDAAEWDATLTSQLRYHALYLASLDLPEMHYSPSVLKLRDKAIAEYLDEAEHT